MAEYCPGKLCGGILFALLCLGKITQKKSIHIEGVGDGLLKEEYLFAAIIHAFTEYKYDCTPVTDPTTIPAYKRCIKDDVANIDFKSESFHALTHGSLYKHQKVLMALKQIVDNFIKSTIEAEILAKRILNVIITDKTIPENASFYFGINNEITLKKDLSQTFTKDLYIEGVLFGAWFYVFEKKRRNTYCTWAFNTWFKKHGENGSTYDFKEDKFYENENLPRISYIRLPEIKVQESNQKEKDLKIVISESNPLLNEYGWYIEHSSQYYSRINTILSPYGVDFYSFYITCGVAEYQPGKRAGGADLLPVVTPKNLIDKFGHRISLIADGGYGKTLFLKHMLLCDKRYGSDSFVEKCNLVPVLVNLNEFRNETKDIEGFVYRQISRFDNNISYDKLVKDLNEGIFLFLFDALDEIGDKEVLNFVREINDFCSRYDKNHFIISSRPGDKCSMLQDFSFLQLLPFTKDKATRLIRKFSSYPKETREKFVNKLGHRLTEIEKNPLLLTIKFMVYANKNEFLDGDSYKFYQKAFETLFETHDKIDSHFTRTYKTKLEMKPLEEVIGSFCFASFFNHLYSFEYDEADNVYDSYQIKEKYNVDLDDLLYDLQNNLCLIYVEGDSFNFIHRSFQEYFTAYYLSLQPADFFKNQDTINMIDSFSRRGYRTHKDEIEPGIANLRWMFDTTTLSPTLNMLGQMKPNKLINYILLPKLKSIFGDPNNPITCLEYLDKIYGTIPYSVGLTDVEDYPSISSDILSFIYSDIINEEYTFHQQMSLDGLEGEFIIDIYFILGWDKETNTPEFTLREDIARQNPENFDENGVLKACGTTYEFKIKDLIENKNKYAILVNSLEKEFKEEYTSFVSAYKKLSLKK